jgi:hypothetical protein
MRLDQRLDLPLGKIESAVVGGGLLRSGHDVFLAGSKLAAGELQMRPKSENQDQVWSGLI